MANQVQLISHGLYAYGVIALPSMAASLSLGEPVQLTPGRYAAGKEDWSERRVQAWSSPLVKVGKQSVCQGLHDAPIEAQGDGFAGEWTGRRLRRTAAATSDFRLLGRRSSEIGRHRRGCVAAFDGRLPDNTTGLGAMAVFGAPVARSLL